MSSVAVESYIHRENLVGDGKGYKALDNADDKITTIMATSKTVTTSSKSKTSLLLKPRYRRLSGAPVCADVGHEVYTLFLNAQLQQLPQSIKDNMPYPFNWYNCP
jgi:hypothetical protein